MALARLARFSTQTGPLLTRPPAFGFGGERTAGLRGDPSLTPPSVYESLIVSTSKVLSSFQGRSARTPNETMVLYVFNGRSPAFTSAGLPESVPHFGPTARWISDAPLWTTDADAAEAAASAKRKDENIITLLSSVQQHSYANSSCYLSFSKTRSKTASKLDFLVSAGTSQKTSAILNSAHYPIHSIALNPASYTTEHFASTS